MIEVLLALAVIAPSAAVWTVVTWYCLRRETDRTEARIQKFFAHHEN